MVRGHHRKSSYQSSHGPFARRIPARLRSKYCYDEEGIGTALPVLQSFDVLIGGQCSWYEPKSNGIENPVRLHQGYDP